MKKFTTLLMLMVSLTCTPLFPQSSSSEQIKTLAPDAYKFAKTGFSGYCDASTTYQQEYINRVLCGEISNYSSWQDSVADYTAHSTALAATWSEQITVMVGYSRANDKVHVWIDWNMDFIFDVGNNEEFILDTINGNDNKFTGNIVVPAGTPPGDYRMRIRLTHLLAPEPCENSDYGEIEDYTVVVYIPPINDVGVDAILSPDSGPAIGNEIVTIRVKNFGTSAQNNIPVSYSVDGGIPVIGIIKGPLEGNSTFDYTFNGTVNLGTSGQTYVIFACTNLEGDEVPENNFKTENVYHFDPPYCDCSTTTEDEYIANVLFGNIDNSSGWQGGVADYTDQYTVIPHGSSEAITITNGNAWASDIVYVWVDWDQDFCFCNNIEDEQYILTNVGGTGEIFTGDIAVPVGQAFGDYRMRIRMTYSTPPPPGGTATYGEVEDYTLIVEGETGPKIQVTPAMLSQNLETGQSSMQPLIVSNIGDNPLYFEITINTTNETLPADKPPDNACPFSGISHVTSVKTSFDGFTLTKPGDSTHYSTDDATIRYDNGVNHDTFGLVDNDTFEVAAYFPASTMEQYIGMKLKHVQFFIHHDLPQLPTINTKVYGAGSSNSPGELLYESGNTIYNFPGWQTQNINPPIDINGDDLWIGYQVVWQPAGTKPCGLDAGPAVEGFGDWIKINGQWTTLTELGLSNNWNLMGYIHLYGSDVGVTSISSPVSGPNLDEQLVTIKIKNIGTASQINIPVSYTVNGEYPVNAILTDTLVGGVTIEYTFPEPVVLGEVGKTVAIEACTLLAGDENTDNDCKTVYVSNHFPVYCKATTTTEDEYISNVSFGDINNTSGWQDSVACYTNLYTIIGSGTSEEIIITNGNPWANDLVYVWVDWDKDFTFDTGDEQYILDDLNGTGAIFTGEIAVPEGQATGGYRMRIRMGYGTAPAPCGGSTYGEAEDYTLKVANSQPTTWLSASPLSGSLAPDETTTIDVMFNSTGMFDGIYDGSIVFNSNGPATPFITVPVILSVNCPLPPPNNLTIIEEPPCVAHLEWDVPAPTDSLQGYNVYRDGYKINTALITDLYYNDSLPGPEQYFYYVTAVYPECEAASDTVFLVITNITEIEGLGILIFPNPATHFVYIQSGININHIIIVNSMGLIVYNADVDNKTVDINSSGFGKGMYFIRINTYKGIVTRKLVIQ